MAKEKCEACQAYIEFPDDHADGCWKLTGRNPPKSVGPADITNPGMEVAQPKRPRAKPKPKKYVDPENHPGQ